MYEPMVYDRVAVSVEGKVTKARVATVVMEGKRIGLTFKKGDGPTLYQTADVFPLYRYMTMTETGPVAVDKAENGMAVMPLFLIGTK